MRWLVICYFFFIFVATANKKWQPNGRATNLAVYQVDSQPNGCATKTTGDKVEVDQLS